MMLRDGLLFLIGLFVVFVLRCLPVWQAWHLLSPAWVAVFLCYWAVYRPAVVGYAIAFVLGILLDVLQATPLGQHAIALIVMAFVLSYFSVAVRQQSVLAQMCSMILFVFVYQLLLLLLQWQLMLVFSRVFWYQLLLSVLIWPVLRAVLRLTQQRSRF